MYNIIVGHKSLRTNFFRRKAIKTWENFITRMKNTFNLCKFLEATDFGNNDGIIRELELLFPKHRTIRNLNIEDTEPSRN